MMRGVIERQCRADQLGARLDALLAGGGRMQMAYVWFPTPGKPELCYLAVAAPKQPFELWRCRPDGNSMPSLAARAPLLGWYEREITDLSGIVFDGHPEPYPLVVEGLSKPPLTTSGDLTPPAERARAPAFVPDVPSPDVQQLPFGPVRADVLESAQFEFFYLGEHILRYQPRLFFKHRGMELRFAGLTPAAGTVLAERVSGIGSVAHALAYCQAVEAAADCVVPPRAQWLRVLFAELERIYNHLHYFGHLADTTTLKVAQAEGKLLEERTKQLAARVTGSRFLRNVLVPGGLRRDVVPPADLTGQLDSLWKQTRYYLDQLERTGSYLDRLITTGHLPRKLAFDQGATGPVERASGLDRDLRRDHPYASYGNIEFSVPTNEDGDANARAQVRAAELGESVSIVRQVLARIPSGPVRVVCDPGTDTEGLGWAESPRGSLYYAVHIGADGRLARVKIKSPSFSNWRVFPFTVHDTNMMDYAINEASFGLSIAGCDR
jgi:Ni,Fe-hydrogenase III large subunit